MKATRWLKEIGFQILLYMIMNLNSSQKNRMAFSQYFIDERDRTLDRSELVAAIESTTEYRIVRPLGEGGMGVVFLARHTRLEKLVAMKVLSTKVRSDHLKHRFLRETKAHGKLDHPNVVTAFDAGEVDSIPFLVMEFIDGNHFWKEQLRKEDSCR